MPQYAIRVIPSTDPAIISNNPNRCTVRLHGYLNSIEVSNVAPEVPLVTGYFSLQELLCRSFVHVPSSVATVAYAQEIEFNFFWGKGVPYRSLAQMYIDRSTLPDTEPSKPLSKLHLRAWYAGPDPSEPAKGAVLFESADLPLIHNHQYLYLDPPSEEYQQKFRQNGHFVWQEAPVIFHLSDSETRKTGTP